MKNLCESLYYIHAVTYVKILRTDCYTRDMEKNSNFIFENTKNAFYI